MVVKGSCARQARSNKNFPHIQQEKFEDTKVYSEAVNRRTDKIMVKGKEKPKGQTTINKTLHRKLKIEKHKPH